MAKEMTDRSTAFGGLSWNRLGGICGVLMVAFFVVGVIVQGDTPQINDSAADARAWFVDNKDQFLWGDFLVGIGVGGLFIPYLCVLRSFLRRGGVSAERWSLIALLGGVFFALAGAAASLGEGTAAVGAEHMSDELVQFGVYASFYGFGGMSIVLVPFFVGVSMIALAGGVLWKWLGWLGLALAVVALVGAASTIEGDPDGVLSLLSFVSFIGLGVVILATSYAMLTSNDA